jgi:RNA polymerase sigma-70 factor (ECF subfamily)
MTADALTMPFALPEEKADSSWRAPRNPMDEARFESFYRKTAGNLWSYIYRLTGDPATADDLLQKTFFRFLRTNPAVADDEHLRRYVFRTATNLVFDHFREAKRDRSLLELPRGREPRADGGELRHDMARVFGELKPRERVLLWLAHVEGNDHEEIAEALGIKARSVRVLLFRARKRLGGMLQKKGLGPVVPR